MIDMSKPQTCGDCGHGIWWREPQCRWENKNGVTWCYGRDGSRTGWVQQHAPAGILPVRVRAAPGKRCRCAAANREHIHYLEVLPDGEVLGPN